MGNFFLLNVYSDVLSLGLNWNQLNKYEQGVCGLFQITSRGNSGKGGGPFVKNKGMEGERERERKEELAN